jgi:rare lipoprotein A
MLNINNSTFIKLLTFTALTASVAACSPNSEPIKQTPLEQVNYVESQPESSSTMINKQTISYLERERLDSVHKAKREKLLEEEKPIKAAVVTSTMNGFSTYYHDKFQGRPTANGERFDQNKYSAAHRTLPFGTKLRVTNERNGKEVVVTVNDRGPYHPKAFLDLSKRAANELDIISQGIAKVKIEVLK